MAKLFDTAGDEPSRDAKTPARRVGVVVNANLWKSFDYLWPEHLGAPAVGQRVHVPFGRGSRKTLAFVVDVDRRGDLPPGKLKAVADVIDPEPQLDDALYRLGEWISHYYMTPLGMTLAAMVPSAVGRHSRKMESVVYLTSHHKDWSARLGARQRRVLDELYEARKQGVEPLPLESLAEHSGASGDTIKRLAGRELIRIETRPVRLDRLSEDGHDAPFEPNADQQAVLENLYAKLAPLIDGGVAPGFSATLLHGVTGSGKTEVYVRAIRKVVQAGFQAIMLVPEIALATQTLGRLIERLPRVAVLHSGLTGAQRAFYYEQIRKGHASVVVGPRSAVFAPTRRLGLIVVDEEHEPSYKQDTAPRYHGRDVAVMRANISQAAVVLGSATPSLESMLNARQGRYELLRLPGRVRGLAMPRLEIVPLRKELTPGRIELIGRTLTERTAAALDRGEQVILLMNRRGYASHVFCPSSRCGWIMKCDHCERTMVFHQATQLVTCHYCQATATLPEYCPACRGKLLLFGYGIQRIEGELARKFPAARVARMDSDTMTSPKQFQKVFQEFAAGDIDILLGTQMVAKGLDFPGVSLVGVVSADTSLMIPDFRASERTFQLVVQVAGRAGRASAGGQVVVQTLHEHEPAIQFAATHDYDGFAAAELPLREEAGFPPYARMVRFVVRHRQAQVAAEGAQHLAAGLRRVLPESVQVLPAMAAGVARIRDQYRFQVLVIAPRGGMVQRRLADRLGEICRGIAAEVLADVDPINLV